MPWSVLSAAIAAGGTYLASDNAKGAGKPSQAADAATWENLSQSTQLFDYFKSNFMPLEKDLTARGTELTAKSRTYGSPEEQDRAAGEAHADTTQAFSRAREGVRRSLESFGVNPNSGRFANAELTSALEEAKADSFAQNNARKGVRDLGFNKELATVGAAQNIAAMGRGLPATAQTGLASTAAAGTAASNSQFMQTQIQNQQNQQAVAPLVNAAQKGVTKWWGTPSQPQNDGTATQFPENNPNNFNYGVE